MVVLRDQVCGDPGLQGGKGFRTAVEQAFVGQVLDGDIACEEPVNDVFHFGLSKMLSLF